MTRPARAASLEAQAKLTLSLRVTGVRADGYHLLDAEMVTVDLCDRLEIAPATVWRCPAAPGGPGPSVPPGDDNLVRRALAAVGRQAFVRLHKRIPAGAGLGGGSADAAAVLRWAGVTDLEVAARLGADVPVLPGRRPGPGAGRRRAGGAAAVRRGRRAGRSPCSPRRSGCRPQLVYRAWDRLGGAVGSGGPNDLEPAALLVEPRLAAWRDRLGDATGQTARAGRAAVPPGSSRAPTRETAGWWCDTSVLIPGRPPVRPRRAGLPTGPGPGPLPTRARLQCHPLAGCLLRSWAAHQSALAHAQLNHRMLKRHALQRRAGRQLADAGGRDPFPHGASVRPRPPATKDRASRPGDH